MAQTIETPATPRLILRGTIQVPAELVYRAAATLLAAAHLMDVVDPTLAEEFEQLDALGFKLCETLLNPEDGLRDPVAIEAHARGCEIVIDWLRAFAQSTPGDNRITGGALTQKGITTQVLRFEAEAADIRVAGHAMGSAA